MKIAIDFDGVLCNTIKKWIEIFNSEYSVKYNNLKLSYGKITEFDFYSTFHITHEDSRKIFAQCWEQWDTLEPTEFMLNKKMQKLPEMCDAIHVVTANNSTNKKYLKAFLKKHSIPYGAIIFEEEKEKLHYDLFIDDSPYNAQKIFDAGKSVLLYNQPWNQDVIPLNTDDVFLYRVYGIDHAIHIIQNLN